MPRRKEQMTTEPLHFVPDTYTIRRYPLGVMAQYTNGSWYVRLRCPDGIIRRFRSRAVEGGRRTYREGIGAEVRFQILQRDGFRCAYCGLTASATELHVDHVIPVAAGGSNDPANLVTACIACNKGKGTSLVG